MTRSLLDTSHEVRESSIRFQHRRAHDYQRFIRAGERVRVTLEVPNLANAGLGAFFVDVQLEGVLVDPSAA